MYMATPRVSNANKPVSEYLTASMGMNAKDKPDRNGRMFRRNSMRPRESSRLTLDVATESMDAFSSMSLMLPRNVSEGHLYRIVNRQLES